MSNIINKFRENLSRLFNLLIILPELRVGLGSQERGLPVPGETLWRFLPQRGPSQLAKPDKAEATMEGGVLTLTIPKAEEVNPKVINVQAKEKK